MKALWTRWVTFLSREEPATGLALFRIGIGACLLWSLGSPVLSGMVDAMWTDKAYGGYRALGDGDRLIALLGGPTPEVIWSLTALGLLAAAALTLGLGGRLTALIALQIFLPLSDVNNHAGGSDDPLLSNALWLLVLARSTQTLSLDCRRRTGSWTSADPAPAWPRMLAVVQLFLLYWSTGLQKVSAYWTPAGEFSALYYILQQPSWQRVDMAWAAHPLVYPLTQLATAVTWVWELAAPLFPLALWWRYTRDRPGRVRALANRIDLRSWMAGVGIVLHMGILISMEVGPFSMIALSFYFCLWHHDEYASGLARIRRRPGDVAEIG